MNSPAGTLIFCGGGRNCRDARGSAEARRDVTTAVPAGACAKKMPGFRGGKKMDVVKMRKDVKKVKALTIRKLIRHSSRLKSKKGTEEQVLKNQRRVQRLLEEIQTMKRLKPDDVTKTALREDIKFDSIFNKADSTVENRAVTRLITHPLLKQKISAIKDAVKNFKETRMNEGEQGPEPERASLPSEPVKSINQETENKPKQGKAKQKKKSAETKPENKVLNSPVVEILDKKTNVIAKQKRKPEETKLENKAMDSPVVEMVDKKTDVIAKQNRKTEVTKLENKVLNSSVVEMVDKKTDAIAKQNKKTEETKLENKVMDSPVVDKETTLIASSHSNDESTSPARPQAQVFQAVPEVHTEKAVLQKSSGKATVQNKTDKKVVQNIADQKVPSTNESDSSDLEDSDEEDKEYFDDSTEERFLKKSAALEDSDSDSEDDFFIGKVRQTKKKKSSRSEDQVQKDKHPPASMKPSVSGTEEKKASTGPKNARLESVFCTSLSETKQKSSFMKRESKFPPVGNKKAVFPQANTLSRKPQHVKQYQNKVQEQTLHPSWEASRKRKEQSQIAVFQGKKIVFGD